MMNKRIIAFGDRLRDYLKKNDCKMVMASTLVVFGVVYFYYLIAEPYNSDCFTYKGMYVYVDTMWDLTLGRWMTPVIPAFTWNIVNPLFHIITCAVCNVVTAIVVNDIWEIHKRLEKVLIGAVLAVAPATVGQTYHIYYLGIYSIALLLTCISVLILVKKNDTNGFIIATIIFIVALGCSQDNIGTAFFLVAGYMVHYAITDRQIVFFDFVKKAIRYALFFISGMLLYWGIFRLILKFMDQSAPSYAGISDISMQGIFSNITKYIKEPFRFFLNYYYRDPLYGNVLWGILIGISIICGLMLIVIRIRDRQVWVLPIVLILLLMIPFGINSMLLIIPEHGLQLYQIYHMQLMAPFCVSVVCAGIETLRIKKEKIISVFMRAGVVLCLCGIILGYAYQTYASFRTLDIGSRHIKYYVGNALTHALEDDARTDDMPIVFMGFVDDRGVQEWNPLIKYSYFDRAFPFWWDRYEVHSVWPNYCMYYFGVDIGSVSAEQYDNILNSSEFTAMEQYPSSKAYAVIDGCYVILMDRETVAE